MATTPHRDQQQYITQMHQHDQNTTPNHFPSTPHHPSTSTTSRISDKDMSQTLPRIPINLREHKLAIAIPWIIIVSTGCFIPIAIFFGVRYGTDKELTVALSPGLSIFGVSSLYNLFFRTWSLTKSNSRCRPVGVTSRWAMDAFNWNFLLLFLALTAIISAAISTELVRVASLPLTIIMFATCVQLLIAGVGRMLGSASPVRFSSAPRGEPIKSGVLAIAEDIVAVDAKKGTELRVLMHQRYDASPPIQKVCRNLDLLWGISGIGVTAGIVAVIFAVNNNSVGFAVGFSVPWIWAALMAIVTTWMVKAALREEKRYPRNEAAA